MEEAVQQNEAAVEEEAEYQSMLPEYTQYHKKGPVDMKWETDPAKVAFHIQVNRQIREEQISIQVPVFTTDSRVELRERVAIAYSVLQERLEDENKVVMNLTKLAADRKRAIQAAKDQEALARAEEKRLKKGLKNGSLRIEEAPAN